MERPGHLPFCRSFRGNGSSPARYDPRLWRSRIVRAISVAIYRRAAVSARDLRRVLLVGPERNCAHCFLLGRVARNDADLRVLPNL